jgi:hypothetical protein
MLPEAGCWPVMARSSVVLAAVARHPMNRAGGAFLELVHARR